MLTILNRFVLFIAIGVIAYLTYSALSRDSLILDSEDEKIPIISQEMLTPIFIEPQAYASSVDRNPFIVANDGDLDSSAVQRVTDKTVGSSNNTDSVGKLMGILIGDNGYRLALIDGQIHGVGSLVKLSDSGPLWQIYEIEDKSVILTSNGQQTVLKISNVCTDYDDSNDIGTDIMEVEKQKEPIQ